MFVFDTTSAKYIENDHELSDADLKRIILLFLSLLADELELLAGRMAGGDITLQVLQRESIRLIKSGYIAAGILGAGTGAGGSGGRIEATVAVDLRFALDRLERFTRLIEERTMPRARTESAVTKRIRLYAAAANQLFEQGRRLVHLSAVTKDGEAIFSLERNVLGPSEHCEGRGSCVEQTERGWVTIGSLIPVGLRLCGPNCKCRLTFK